MSGNETTSGVARSFKKSPELWIPYILIGVGCVTFLAVHFWCYHKRNRERYLRKRDEKRVKSGLLERRRITTLMLARYQSDLGITHKVKDIKLTRMFYDNSVDVICDETDGYQTVITNKKKPFHSPTAEAKYDVAILAAAGVATPVQTTLTGLRTIANSQTWPLVTERKNSLYNAHRGCSQDNKAVESNGDAFTPNTTDNNSDNSIEDDCIATSTFESSVGVVISDHELTRFPHSGNHAQKLTAQVSRPDKDHKTQTCVVKSSPSPSSYPSVFYTSLNSSRPSHSSFISAFKPKSKKRRFEGGSMKDGNRDNFGMDNNELNNWEEWSSLYHPENAFSETRTFYSQGNPSDRFVSGEPNLLCSGYKRLEKAKFATAEALPFAEGDLAYGSITHNSQTESIQMIPLADLSRSSSNQNPDRITLRGNSATSHENPVCSPDSGDIEDSMSSPTTSDTHTSGLRVINPTIIHNRLPQQNIIIPFSEKSRLNIITKNPGKIRAAAYGSDSSKFCLSRQRPRTLTKRDMFDNQNIIPKHQQPQNDYHDIKTQTARLSQESEINIYSASPDHVHETDRPERSFEYVVGSNINLSNDNDTVANVQGHVTGSVSNSDMKTQKLQNLNTPCLSQGNNKTGSEIRLENVHMLQ